MTEDQRDAAEVFPELKGADDYVTRAGVEAARLDKMTLKGLRAEYQIELAKHHITIVEGGPATMSHDELTRSLLWDYRFPLLRQAQEVRARHAAVIERERAITRLSMTLINTPDDIMNEALNKTSAWARTRLRVILEAISDE